MALARESTLPRGSLLRLDFSEDRLGSANDMIARHEVSNDCGVARDLSKEGLVADLARDVELLVHLGGE